MELGANPWDRQAGETPPAFAAFQAYRDLPPGDRSSVKVREKLGLRTDRHLEKWRSKHEWVARAAAWDAHLDAASQAAQLDLRRILAEELIGGDGQHFREVAAMLRTIARAGDVQAMKEYLNRTVGTVPKELNIGTRQDLEALISALMSVVVRETADDDLAQRIARGLADELERRSARR